MKKFLKENAEYILIGILLGLAVILAGIWAVPEETEAREPEYYAEALFDDTKVHEIRIKMTKGDLKDLRENAGEKIKYHADVEIDGVWREDVSFATRGNFSLQELAANEATERYAYTINFGKYVKGQDYLGLDKLILNNLSNDQSEMHDFLAYYMMRKAGVEAPLAAYTKLYINGEYQGLYLATEAVEDGFLARNGNAKNASLFKPEALLHDATARKEFFRKNPEATDEDLMEASKKNGGGALQGTDLVYRGGEPAKYEGIFNNAATKVGREEEEEVVEILRVATEGASEGEIMEKWDVERLINYFVVDTFVINSDAYLGTAAHNYFLKINEGRATLLPWDYDLAFALRWTTPEEEIPLEEQIVKSISEPTMGVEAEERPVWQMIARNQDFLEKYYEIYRKFLAEEMESGEVAQKVVEIRRLILPYVVEDPTKFYTLAEFEEGVEYLQAYLRARTENVAAQLEEIETREGEAENWSGVLEMGLEVNAGLEAVEAGE